MERIKKNLAGITPLHLKREGSMHNGSPLSGTDAKTSHVMGADTSAYSTIAVDFDGTLCENRFPEVGEPKPRVIAYIKQQAAAGARIILHTCRENGTRRALLDEAIEFCRGQGIPLYAVNENPGNHFCEEYGTGGRKVYADLYIDDKAVNVTDIEMLMEQETEDLRVEKYSWAFNGAAENWGYNACDTVEECIATARKAVAERDYVADTSPEVVYIGENAPFVPWVDPELVLKEIQEQAADFAGELGGDWDAYNHKKQDELSELADSLSRVVNEWLEKYGYAPSFYAVQNIKVYQL